MKSFSKSTILGITFGILLAGYAVFAFQGPTQTPPGGNVPVPLNVGPDPQVKSGGLWVGSLGVDGGVTIGGGLSIGNTLNLQGNKITNIGNPINPGDVITKKYLDDAFIAAGLADSDKDGVVDNLDCAPSDNTKWQNRLFYTDSDKDGYGNAGTAANQCVGSATPSGFSTNGTDCYDGNANARPGQTAYFTSNRGDGSWDYNCDGAIAASNGVIPVTKKPAGYSGGYSAYVTNPAPPPSCIGYGTTRDDCGGCFGCTAVSLPADCGSTSDLWVGPTSGWNVNEDPDTGSITCLSPGPEVFVCTLNTPPSTLRCR